MAECLDLRLNHVLCFLFSKLNKTAERHLKTTILDYYTTLDIHEAKEVFLNAVSTFSGINALSRIRDRHGDGRERRELDDIFTIINELDEKKVLSDLPTFVSNCTDNMPSNVIVDGDLRAVMSRFDKMESQIFHLQSTVNNLASAMLGGAAIVPSQHRVAGLSVSGPPTDVNSRPAVGPASAPTPAPTPASDQLQSADRTNGDSLIDGSSVGLSLRGIWADETGDETELPSESDDWHTQNSKARKKRRRIRSDRDQATVGSLPANLINSQASTPAVGLRAQAQSISHVHSSVQRIDQVLNQTDNDNDRSTDRQSYAAAVNKPVVKRPLQAASRQPQRLNTNTIKKPYLVVGRSRVSRDSASNHNRQNVIAAAKPYLNKATFCIDNVSTEVTELAMAKFVAAMDIDVLGCYNVNPRRTRYQRLHGIMPTDRKTFRLCIPREDTKRLLNAQLWPAHISVSRWRFKKREETSDDVGSDVNSGGYFDHRASVVIPNQPQFQSQVNGRVAPSDRELGVVADSEGAPAAIISVSLASGILNSSCSTDNQSSHISTRSPPVSDNGADMDTTIICGHGDDC